MQLASAEKLLARPQTREVRRVEGLKWAELREHGPFSGKHQNRNAKACVKKGHSYERSVHREIKRLDLGGEICLHQWIMFADSNGLGWAQPDIFIIWDNLLLLIECKLTQSSSAEIQLLSLYLPLLKEVYQLPTLCLQVCKNLKVVPRKFVDGPEDLLGFPSAGVHTWHYIGN